MNETRRVWRVRKNHTWIDARMRDEEASGAVELLFFYDDSLVFARRCRTRDEALADAHAYLQNLQRAGWNTHW